MIKNRISRKELDSVVSESKTITEVLKSLNISLRGRNYDTIRDLLNYHKIDISHFVPYSSRVNCCKSKTNLENVLIENSTYSTGNLKKRLYKENIKDKICELCGQSEIWQGKKMSLILDHINGINNDNRLENLRIVCPNCNATLDTHCGKNKKRAKLYFCSCGNKKLKNSNNCNKCNHLKSRKVERPKIEVLLNEINNLGYSAVGRKYNVSDNAVRRWIK